MKSQQLYYVCDECLIGSEPAYHAHQRDVQAKAQGWRRVQGRDLCPECLERVA